MNAIYGASCALVTKNGVCHQCVELDGFFASNSSDPLAESPRDLQARLAVLHELRDKGMGRWHVLLFELLDELS
jgi:RNA polymerase sigma-70 factor (ECF subfamily)